MSGYQAQVKTLHGRPQFQQWMVALSAGAGLSLAAMDTAVNVALPAITRGFGTDMQTIQWIIVAHIATRAGLSVGAGSSGDLFGLKRVFLVGIVCYTVAITAISFTPSLYSVFGLRVLQGIGTGSLLASAPVLAARAFPPSLRGQVLGVAFASQAAGLMAATLGAAALLAAFGWESVFLARIPIALATFGLGWVYLQPDQPARGDRSFDFLGAMALSGSLVTLVVGLHVGGRDGWVSSLAISMLVLSPGLVVLLLYVERRVTFPALDLGLLRSPWFIAPFVATFLAWTGVFVLFFIFPFYITDVLGRGVSVVGVMLGTMAAAMFGSSLLGGWLSDRVQPGVVAVVGVAVLAAALAWMASLDQRSTLTQVGTMTAVVGAGLGLAQIAAYTLVIQGAVLERAGTASGSLSVAEGMGRVLSVAIFGSLFDSRMDHHRGQLPPRSPDINQVNAAAFVSAMQEIYIVAALIAALGLLAFILLLRAKTAKESLPRVQAGP